MARWIRRTAVNAIVNIPVRRFDAATELHACIPPDAEAGPRSIWECDCGRRWRLAVPYWRPVDSHAGDVTPSESPAWLAELKFQPPNDGERL